MENIYKDGWGKLGKTLGCWCKPDACHGDFLKTLIRCPIKTVVLFARVTSGVGMAVSTMFLHFPHIYSRSNSNSSE